MTSSPSSPDVPDGAAAPVLAQTARAALDAASHDRSTR